MSKNQHLQSSEAAELSPGSRHWVFQARHLRLDAWTCPRVVIPALGVGWRWWAEGLFSSSARRKKKFPVPALIPGFAWAKFCLPSVKHQSSSKGFRAKHRSLAQAPGEPWSWGFSSLVPRSANQAWSSPAAEEERAVVFGDRTWSICPGLGGGKKSGKVAVTGCRAWNCSTWGLQNTCMC